MNGITNRKLNNISKNPSIAPLPVQTPKECAVIRSIRLVFPFSKRRAATSESAVPLAGMLVAAVLAAVLVVADQLVETWADGHLLLIWVALWTVVFAALALLAPPLRQLANAMAKSVSCIAQARAQKRADDDMWRHAQTDARVMNDIQVAMTRSQSGD